MLCCNNKNALILQFLHPCRFVKETAPEIAKDGSSFDREEIVDLDYTGLFTTLVDLLHVIQHVGEGHEGWFIYSNQTQLLKCGALLALHMRTYLRRLPTVARGTESVSSINIYIYLE